MKDLLTAWAQPLTAEGDMDHSSMMGGMMTADELTQLGTKVGPEFDAAWVVQ